MKIKITEQNLADIKSWFSAYLNTFREAGSEILDNIKLKEDHSLRVCREIVITGRKLGLNEDELRLAEIIALLHDTGRFEQYARYKTFMDKKSGNHALMGIKVLREAGILEQFSDEVKELIIKPIRYHNCIVLPENETESCLFYSKLLRDADKIDIWYILTAYYKDKSMKKNAALELELPDTPGISEAVYKDLINKRPVNMAKVHNLNDFKMLQAGWIFDINFYPSMELVKERRYLEIIRENLPQSPDIDNVFSHLFQACSHYRLSDRV